MTARFGVGGVRAKRGVRRAAVLLLAAFAAACSNPGAATGAGETKAATTVEETAGSTGVPFVVSPEASGGSSYEADTMLAVRYGVHEGYERVVLDLGTGGEPAETVPEWTLVSPKGDGLLRVTLPSVSATRVSDGKFGDDLLKSFYVVRAPEGGMFVDFFRAEGFRVPGTGALGARAAGRRLQAFGKAPRSTAAQGRRQHGARGAARWRPDRHPSDRQRLLPQLRGVEHRRPGELQGGRRSPAESQEQ
jgi:hypothetical protein